MIGLDSVTNLQRFGLERLHCVEFLIMYVTRDFPMCRFMFTLLHNATCNLLCKYTYISGICRVCI